MIVMRYFNKLIINQKCCYETIITIVKGIFLMIQSQVHFYQIYDRISTHIISMQRHIPVRKNIQALSKQERQQYFWCLKMLGILPSFQALKDRYFWTLGTEGPNSKQRPYNHIGPSTLHDQLIANHGTCCQHSSFFFPYFHRHLMFHFQMRLNYVDEVLRMSQEEFASKFFQLFGKNQQLWKTVLAEYKQLVPQRKKVMAHYWNPTNYNNRDDLVIPIELADPKLFFHELDPVDQLHKLVRGSYPYEINVRSRWYNDPSKLDEEMENFVGQMIENQYFYPQPFEYEEHEKQMTRGEYNPRQNTDLSKFLDDYIRMTCFKSTHCPSTVQSSASRNYQKFKETQKMNTFYQDQGQVLINCGGRFGSKQKQFKMHYFSSAQIQKSGKDRCNMVNYNKMLPHYQLAYALFNEQYQSLTDYIKPTGSGIENPHNTIHTNMHFSMVDGSFSLLNLMFFPYHSWIDIQLEIKIRMCNHPKEAHKMYKILNSTTYRKQNFEALINPQGKQKLYGQYPLLQWVDPKFILYVMDKPQNDIEGQLKAAKQVGITQDSIKIAFPFKELYLRNPNQLRTSLHLHEFYQKVYKPKHGYLYAQFKGFQQYDCSYDYQIFETVYNEETQTLSNLTYPLGDYPQVNIPSYLTAMRNQVNSYYQHLKTEISKITNQDDSIFYRKLVQKNFLLLVKYRSSIPNRTYVFTANFSKLADLLLQKGVKLTQEQEGQMRQQRPLLILPFFGKSKDSSKCINCGNYKYRVINLCEQLFERHPRIWPLINKVVLTQAVYTSSEVDRQQEINIQQLMNLSFLKEQFLLSYVRGAQQVRFNLFVKPHSARIDEFELKLTLDTNKLQSNQPLTKVTRSIESVDLIHQKQFFNYHFDFYQSTDNPQDLKRNNLDEVIYTHVKGDVYLNGLTHQFSFAIKNYHEIIRYNITISEEEGGFSVEIVDADFKFKRILYNTCQSNGKDI